MEDPVEAACQWCTHSSSLKAAWKWTGSFISFMVIMFGRGSNSRCWCCLLLYGIVVMAIRVVEFSSGALCVQMDFTRTFEANAKCNNINYVWIHFYQTLVVLMYHRRLWNNNFDTDISRSINIPKKAKYAPLMWVLMHLKMSVSKILFHRRLWHFRTTKIW